MTDAATLLYSIRTGRSPRVAHLPAELSPADEAQAYRIQLLVLQQLGTQVAGWKASMSDAQHGLSAPIARGNVLHSPASLGDLAHRTANTQRFGIEPEIAFTLGQALPPLGDGQSYRRGQVIAAVASAHSAVEICVARLSDFNAAPPLERLADSIMNEGLVLGPGVASWQQLDMAKRGLMLQIGGRIAHQGVGGHPLDDPLLPLVWLANHLSARAVGLQAGDVVTTGSCAGIHWAEAGSLASAEFEGLGGVVLNC